jgi:hypothetical protein
MQRHKHFWHLRHLLSQQRGLGALLGAGALLALLFVAGRGTARAAPASAPGPKLTILSSGDNILMLEFDFWSFNVPLTLSYSQNATCDASTLLPDPDFEVSSAHFQHNYTLPGDIPQGAYHLCASDTLDGTIASDNTLFITNAGAVQLTPPVPTLTPTPTRPRAGGGSTPPPTNSPGNRGATANGSNNAGGNTLVAIILLCLLVLALLAYLIRLWLVQGQQPPTGGQATQGQQPPGGGQTSP